MLKLHTVVILHYKHNLYVGLCMVNSRGLMTIVSWICGRSDVWQR